MYLLLYDAVLMVRIVSLFVRKLNVKHLEPKASQFKRTFRDNGYR
jgi:hypothetical protein